MMKSVLMNRFLPTHYLVTLQSLLILIGDSIDIDTSDNYGQYVFAQEMDITVSPRNSHEIYRTHKASPLEHTDR